MQGQLVEAVFAAVWGPFAAWASGLVDPVGQLSQALMKDVTPVQVSQSKACPDA